MVQQWMTGMTLQHLRQLLPTITIGPDDILHYVVRRADQSGDTSDSTSNTTQRNGATQTAEVGFTMLLEGSVDTTQHKGATQTAEVGLQCCWKVLWTRRSIREQHRWRRWVLQCCWKVLSTRTLYRFGTDVGLNSCCLRIGVWLW